MKNLRTYIQYILPQRWLTSLMGYFADLETPWLKNFFINRFISKYKVDMKLASIEDPSLYPTFNHFFIRELKADLRPIIKDKNKIASPVDGKITEIGNIEKNRLLQVKKIYFDLENLLGGSKTLADYFYDGSFATFYLAPFDYHRVHMPLSGQLEETIYVPGKLFSVNPLTSSLIPQLYCRNERIISVFSTDCGPMAVILVGAMIVGKIQTVWLKEPISTQGVQHLKPTVKTILNTGDLLGQFSMGSTVIVLFSKNKMTWSADLHANSLVKFGQLIGEMKQFK